VCSSVYIAIFTPVHIFLILHPFYRLAVKKRELFFSFKTFFHFLEHITSVFTNEKLLNIWLNEGLNKLSFLYESWKNCRGGWHRGIPKVGIPLCSVRNPKRSSILLSFHINLLRGLTQWNSQSAKNVTKKNKLLTLKLV